MLSFGTKVDQAEDGKASRQRGIGQRLKIEPSRPGPPTSANTGASNGFEGISKILKQAHRTSSIQTANISSAERRVSLKTHHQPGAGLRPATASSLPGQTHMPAKNLHLEGFIARHVCLWASGQLGSRRLAGGSPTNRQRQACYSEEHRNTTTAEAEESVDHQRVRKSQHVPLSQHIPHEPTSEQAIVDWQKPPAAKQNFAPTVSKPDPCRSMTSPRRS